MKKINDTEMVALYQSGEKVARIQQLYGVSRAAVYLVLKKHGIEPSRKTVVERVCRFCGEKFTRIGYAVKREGKNGGYCSPECFHADRSLTGSFSSRGVDIDKFVQELTGKTARSWSRHAAKVLREVGLELKPGQVVHHIDGCRWNNDISNLQIFESQSEHMKFHHSLRDKKKQRG